MTGAWCRGRRIGGGDEGRQFFVVGVTFRSMGGVGGGEVTGGGRRFAVGVWWFNGWFMGRVLGWWLCVTVCQLSAVVRDDVQPCSATGAVGLQPVHGGPECGGRVLVLPFQRLCRRCGLG